MKVLLAIDGSSYSEEATRLVATRPWPLDTIVRVLMTVESMVPIPDVWVGVAGVQTLELAREEMTNRAKLIVADAADKLKEAGLKVESNVIYGDPRSVIVDQAAAWSADLIVVGSHGYTGLTRLLLGSVAQSVVSHSPSSVEVVRKKQPAEGSEKPEQELGAGK